MSTEMISKTKVQEIKEIIAEDMKRKSDIWHNGSIEQRAALLEEDAEEFMESIPER